MSNQFVSPGNLALLFGEEYLVRSYWIPDSQPLRERCRHCGVMSLYNVCVECTSIEIYFGSIDAFEDVPEYLK